MYSAFNVRSGVRPDRNSCGALATWKATQVLSRSDRHGLFAFSFGRLPLWDPLSFGIWSYATCYILFLSATAISYYAKPSNRLMAGWSSEKPQWPWIKGFYFLVKNWVYRIIRIFVCLSSPPPPRLLLVIEEGEKIKYVTDFYFIDCWFVSQTFVMCNPSGIQQV